MQDHSVVSIISFLLTFFCYLSITLPVLLPWLLALWHRIRDSQKALPKGETKAPYCQGCSILKNTIVI